MWQRTRDSSYETAVNWVTKQIRRLTERALERLDPKIGNSEDTPQSIRPIAKSLLKRDGPRAPTAIDGPLGLTFLPLEKDNAIADGLENQFTPHNLCNENHNGGSGLESKLYWQL
jgi:hypothetical protein